MHALCAPEVQSKLTDCTEIPARTIGAEVVADKTLHERLPQPSPAPRPPEAIDTRSGLPSQGPATDNRILPHVDRIAEGFARIDQAEAIRQHEEARKRLGEEE